MQFRRLSALLVSAVLGLTGVLSLGVAPMPASADNVKRNFHGEAELRQKISMARANQLRTAAVDETVWVGHRSSGGGYGPFKVGTGPRRQIGGKNATNANMDGIWGFDNFQIGESDSMQGWWSIQGSYGSVGPSNLHDYQRSFFGFDYGNQANHYPRQGRTFGVTGIWHADNGTIKTDSIPGSNVQVPGWSPITGTRSMWCGIRSPGDLTMRDVTGTGNPINAELTQFQGNNSGRQIGPLRPQGTDHNFPGYGSQWDQLLYRDILFASNATGAVTVSFKYTTRLAVQFDGVHSSQTGYFYFDPLKTTATAGGSDGNFISLAVTGPATAPVDSFMAYVGAPVEPTGGANNDFIGSDGNPYDVFDVQRRWFSEVIRTTNIGAAPGSNTTWDQLLSATGTQGTTGAPLTSTTILSQAAVNAILDADGGAGNGGRLRLVFRVKTNRGFDDENTGNGGFTSGGAGAAIIDDVTVSGGGVNFSEGFEGSNGGVDNGTGVAATAAWKSTGKPPSAWFHIHNVETGGLPWSDPCGDIGAPVRLCNMGGNVMSPGLHDLGDKTGGVYGGNFENQQKHMVSPTMNLKAPGPATPNAMGIDGEMTDRTIQLFGDLYVNVYDLFATGNTFRFLWQAYPSRQPNGAIGWGEATMPIFNYSSTVPRGCIGGGGFFGLLNQAGIDSPILTSNPPTSAWPNGKPDSIRVYIQSQSRCFTQPLTAATCSPTSSSVRFGGYLDNLSIGFITAPPPPSLSFALWDVFNDAFPVNSTNKSESPYSTAFDTLGAHVKAGFNTADNTGVLSGPGARESVPADTAFVGANGENVRVDLVFRILPGVGNYVTIGTPASGVARRPDTNPRVAALAADAGNGALTAVDKFFGAYMADNGAYGTGGNGTNGPGHAGNVWDKNRWNSTRMDTLEVNFWRLGTPFGTGATDQLTPGSYMSTIHESDPKYTILGIAKGRCFIQNTNQKLDENNVNCGSLGGGGTPYPPTYITSTPNSGYNSNEIAGQPGKTFEFTKILPDGQFTPGAHIQYFFRKSTIGQPGFEMAPDTNFTFNDNADPHRWLEYSVLPDRWKNVGFGGSGMACMLVLDIADGRGDELMWVSMADSIGLTEPGKRGAHNGWRARPDQDITVNIGGDDTIARRDNGGQAGSMYDLFETIAGESNVSAGHPGSRGAAKNNQGSSLTINKWSTMGPSGAMARNYRQIYLLASDIGNTGLLGPFVDQTDADVALFTDFLTLPGGSAQPRAMFAAGYQLGEGMARPAIENGQPDFMINILRAGLRNADYRALTGTNLDVIDLVVQPAAGGVQVPQTYGVGNICLVNNDVFSLETTPPAGQVGAYYENVTGPGPYVATVFAPTSGLLRNYVTLLSGFTIGLFGGGFGTETDLLNVGIRKYFYDHMTNAFGGMVCQPTGQPVGIGDNPGSGDGSAYVNFARFKSSNPHRSGEVRFAFGLAKSEKVEVRVFDVTGRMVKMVANRTFAAGQEHVVTWDGTDEAGNKVKSGVYFYQLRTNDWTSKKKLAVLTN